MNYNGGVLKKSAVLAAALAAAGCVTADSKSRASAAPRPEPELPLLARAPEDAPKAKVMGHDPQGCTWIESQAAVTVGDQESRHQARAAAVSEARISAMQDFLGVSVRSKFLDFQQEGLRDQQALTESILQTTRQGRILKEELLAEGYRDAPGCPGCRYAVKLKTCLVPAAEGADKDFQVELELSRTRLIEGDHAKLTVTSSRDAYVYVYNVGMAWESALIVPNEALAQVKVAAGAPWDYPDESMKKRGVSLLAQLPSGRPPVSAETVRVIAAKTPLPPKIADPADGGYLGVLRRLHGSRYEWAEDAQAFTIYRER